jgi:GNAT superfamily N-acetyltransferase
VSLIETLPWDSQQLGLSVGRLVDFDFNCTDYSLEDYGLVLARVPQQKQVAVARLQTCGFIYIGVDLRLVVKPYETKQINDTRWQVRRVSRSIPDFRISGFHIEYSRLMLDSACRSRLPSDFWDRMVYEHCTEFADIVIYAVDKNNDLAGFASCLMRKAHLDLFLVAVHSAYQGGGLGRALLIEAEELARERGLKLSTSVMASNVHGFNFYIRNNFLVESGEVIMHRWRDKAQDDH